MAVRLRPGLRVLRRSATEVQVGTDPRWAVRLTDLQPDEVEALVSIDARTDLRSLGHQARLSPARLGPLVDALLESGLTVDEARSRSLPGPATVEAAAVSLARGGADPVALLQTRATRTVGVLGLGPVGLGVAVTLAAAGVGTLVLDDERPVRSADIGPCGYRWSDAGSPRSSAAARILRDVQPEIRLGQTEEPDALVLVEHGAAAPERAHVLLTSGVPHLSVVVREGGVVVGPFVQPADPRPGACLRCLDLHRVDHDPLWPVVAAQLAAATSVTRSDAGTGARSTAWDEPVVVSAMAAAVAAADVLAVLDGCVPRTRSTTVEIAVPDAVPRERSWAVHPSCGCTALPGVDVAIDDRRPRSPLPV